MNPEVKQTLINRMLSNISSIHMRVGNMSFDTFRQEEVVREEIYSQLQEIGQTAGDLLQAADTALDLRNDLELLKRFTGATHNQHTEVNHRATWSIINQDLLQIAERLEQSEAYVK